MSPRLGRRLPSIALALCVGCSASPSPSPSDDPGEPTATTASALSTADAVARAQEWSAVMVPYCQSANGQPDPDTSCSPTCTRPKNAAWDPYRSDCSGFVSWAWGLPAPGRITDEFAPFQTDLTQVIDASELRPGDACNRASGGHMVLFEKWITPGTEAAFLEEPGCSSATPYAHEFTSQVTLSGTSLEITYEGASFIAIRYPGLTVAAAPDDGGALDVASPRADAAPTPPDAEAGGAYDAGGSADAAAASGSEASAPAPVADAPPVEGSPGGGTGCSVGVGPSQGDAGALGALLVAGAALARPRRRRR